MALVDFSSFSFLLIDDFGHYRAMLKSILRTGGAQKIDDAWDGPSAIEKLESNHYDVVLCDYNLGDCQDGQQILEETKHRGLLPDHTIFIMVTAENSMAMVMGVIEFRPDAYLNKPFTKEVLRDRLDRILARRKVLDDIIVADRRQDYPEAIRLCNQKLREYPKLALEIAKKKGAVLEKSGDQEAALAHYRRVVQAANVPWAKLGLAQVLIRLNDYAEAESVLTDLLDTDRQLIEAYDLLAEALLKQGKNEAAEKILAQGVKVSPKGVVRHQKLAKIATANEHPEISERAYRAAIREGKHSYFGSPEDHTALVKIYMQRNDTRRALQVINNAEAQYRKDPAAKTHLSALAIQVHENAGQHDQALRLFQKTISSMSATLSELPAQAVADLLETCQLLGEDEVAECIQEDVKEGHPFSDHARQKYTSLLLNSNGVRAYKAGDIRGSIKKFDEAAKYLQDRIAVNLNAAQSIIVYLQKHGVDADMLARAREYLDRCMALDQHNERYVKLEKMYAEMS